MASFALIGFWLISSFLLIISAVVFRISHSLPQEFLDLLFYGKMKGMRTKRSIVQIIEVPKSWFKHFYLVGLLVNGFAFYVITKSYLYRLPLPLPSSLIDLMLITGEVSTDSLSAIFLIGMMVVQDARRLLECNFVSVYSSGTMNLLHYALGLIFYSTFSISVIAEAPRTASDYDLRLSWRHVLGLSLFLWSSWHQNRINVSFAQLRKNKQGSVVTYEHSVPNGGWFDLVSCPHYLMEILIYVAFFVVAGVAPPHKTLSSVVVFVISNQIVAGYFVHRWYRENFRSYSKRRKAILPYLL